MAIQGGDVESVPLPYKGGAAQVLQTGLSVAPQDLIQCSGRVCWVDEGTNAIDQVDPSAGPVKAVVNMPPWFGEAASVAFDGTNFYVSNYVDGNGGNRIARFLPAATGQPATIARPVDGGALAVDDECLYWTSADGIYSIAKTAPGTVGQ
jgi:DNA-binding beta-propeller fold protein YncE